MKIARRVTYFVAVAWLLPALAHAEPSASENSDNQVLTFKDDPLNALSNEPLGRTLILKVGRARPSLIRPRTHFLSELRDSANDL